MKKKGNDSEETSVEQDELVEERNADSGNVNAGEASASYASQNNHGKQKKPFYKKVWFWVVIIFIIACLAVAGSDDEDDEEDTAEEEEVTEESAEASDEEDTEDVSYEEDEETDTEEAATETATEEETAEADAEEETEETTAEEEITEEEVDFVSILAALGTFEETTYTGNGDDVITLDNPGYPALLEISYSGESNFTVHTVDAEGENVDLLVNTIGSYSGTVTDYTDYSEVTMLSIGSSGDWSITVKPMSSMAELVNGQSYSGDGVYYIDTDELMTLTITNTGESNFVVRAIGISDTDLLVNEIGDYSGTVIWTEPQSFLIVESEGTWTVSW